MRVLIVDDDPDVREVLRSMVAAEGYESVEAASAEEALALARQQEFAIALCDVCLPGKDGLWFLSEPTFIRPHTAIVVATGVQDIDTAVRSVRMGAVDYLVRPFSGEALTEALQRAHYAYVANCEHANAQRTLRQRERQLATVVAELRQATSLLALAHNLVVQGGPMKTMARFAAAGTAALGLMAAPASAGQHSRVSTDLKVSVTVVRRCAVSTTVPVRGSAESPRGMPRLSCGHAPGPAPHITGAGNASRPSQVADETDRRPDRPTLLINF